MAGMKLGNDYPVSSRMREKEKMKREGRLRENHKDLMVKIEGGGDRVVELLMVQAGCLCIRWIHVAPESPTYR